MATGGTPKWYPMGREQVVPYDRDLTVVPNEKDQGAAREVREVPPG